MWCTDVWFNSIALSLFLAINFKATVFWKCKSVHVYPSFMCKLDILAMGYQFCLLWKNCVHRWVRWRRWSPACVQRVVGWVRQTRGWGENRTRWETGAVVWDSQDEWRNRRQSVRFHVFWTAEVHVLNMNIHSHFWKSLILKREFQCKRNIFIVLTCICSLNYAAEH